MNINCVHFQQVSRVRLFALPPFWLDSESNRSRTESNKSRTKRQESNRVEQLPSARTSRGDPKLSEKSYYIKIGSLVAENESKTSHQAIFQRKRLPGAPTYFPQRSLDLRSITSNWVKSIWDMYYKARRRRAKFLVYPCLLYAENRPKCVIFYCLPTLNPKISAAARPIP